MVLQSIATTTTKTTTCPMGAARTFSYLVSRDSEFKRIITDATLVRATASNFRLLASDLIFITVQMCNANYTYITRFMHVTPSERAINFHARFAPLLPNRPQRELVDAR